jgi:hypothetical protein
MPFFGGGGNNSFLFGNDFFGQCGAGGRHCGGCTGRGGQFPMGPPVVHFRKQSLGLAGGLCMPLCAAAHVGASGRLCFASVLVLVLVLRRPISYGPTTNKLAHTPTHTCKRGRATAIACGDSHHGTLSFNQSTCGKEIACSSLDA